MGQNRGRWRMFWPKMSKWKVPTSKISSILLTLGSIPIGSSCYIYLHELPIPYRSILATWIPWDMESFIWSCGVWQDGSFPSRSLCCCSVVDVCGTWRNACTTRSLYSTKETLKEVPAKTYWNSAFSCFEITPGFLNMNQYSSWTVGLQKDISLRSQISSAFLKEGTETNVSCFTLQDKAKNPSWLQCQFAYTCFFIFLGCKSTS